MPELSIVMPVYKAEKYLSTTVQSVLGQTYTDFELLLIDDGSPDGCPVLCEALSKKDKRIRVIHKPNGGVSSARNIGLIEAQGKYLAFIDADDLIEPQMYKTLIKLLEEHEADIAMGGVVVEKEYHPAAKTKVEVHCFEEPLELLAEEKLLAGSIWNKVYKRTLLQDLRFDEAIQYSEDHLFVVQVFLKTKKLVLTSRLLYHYMQREGSTSWQDGDYRIWQGNLKARQQIYELIKAAGKQPQLQQYAFAEYAKAIFALFRFAIKYQNKEEYNKIKETYREVIKAYLDTGQLSLGKKWEYKSYMASYDLASLIHYYPKKWKR